MGRVLLAVLAMALFAAAPAAAQDAPVEFPCPADAALGALCFAVGDVDAVLDEAYPISCPEEVAMDFLTRWAEVSCWALPGQQDLPSPEGPACATLPVEGAVAVTAFSVRRPGEEWKDGLNFACLELYTAFSASEQSFVEPWIGDILVLQARSPRGASELAPKLPAGTEFSVELQSSGAEPAAAGGTMRDPVVRFDGPTLVVQGRSTTQRIGPGDEFNLGCDQAFEFESVFDVNLTLSAANPDLADRYPYRGSFFTSNAQVLSDPIVSDDQKSVLLDLRGCGDGRPDTNDGFFQGFIPSNSLAKMGLKEPLLDAVPDAAVDQLLTLADNGAEAPEATFESADPADLKLDNAPGISVPLRTAEEGVYIDYELSFSRHKLRTSTDRRAARKAKRCRKSGGKVRVKGKGKKARLVCRQSTR